MMRVTVQCITLSPSLCSKFCLNPRWHRGGGCNPLEVFFANNSRKRQPVATKLSVPASLSILHPPWKVVYPDPTDPWPVTYFSRPRLVGIPIRRMSARISRALAAFSWFQTFKHVIWCWSHVLGWVSRSPEGWRSGHVIYLWWPQLTFSVLHGSSWF